MYNMELIFEIDIAEPALKKMMTDLNEPYPIIQNALIFSIKQSLPVVPDGELIGKYAEIIKEQYKNKNIEVENVRFSHYKYFEQDPSTLSCARAKQLLFETLQLIRRTEEKNGHDPVDIDDSLFSKIDIEKSELEEIFRPYNISVNSNSCFNDNESPKNYDKIYFS